MKRKWLLAIIASVVAVGGAIGASALSDSLSSDKRNSSNVEVEVDDDEMVTLDTKTILSVEELFDIVLAEVDGTIEEIELEAYDKDHVYFEVEVKQKGKEYKLYVDAYSGKVLDKKLDDDDDEKHQAKKENSEDQSTSENNEQKQPSKQVTVETKTDQTKANNDVKNETKKEETTKKVEQNKQTTETNKESSKKKEATQNKKSKDNEIISTEEAIEIALNMANGKVIEVELDKDDGRLEYEVEIDLPNGKEAEIEIDAYTGKVLEFELDD